MPLRSTPLDEPVLILTPMIDIMLTLVIFLIVTAKIAENESQFQIELPRVSDAQPLTSLPDELIVNITRDGQYLLGDQPRSAEALAEDLRAAAQRFAEQAVIIRAAADGPYQHVMSVLDLCHRAKLTNIQLANRVESASTP